MQTEAGGDPDPLEAQPLLGHHNRDRGRDNFQTAEREAARRGVFRFAAPLSCLIMLGLAFFITFIVYVEVKTWIKVFYYWAQDCDTPLWTWMFVRAVLGPVASPWRFGGDELQTVCAKLGHTVFQVIWLAQGYYWKSQEVTCRKTQPDLYEWVNFLTIVCTFTVAVGTSFFVLVYCIDRSFVHLMHIGVIRNPNAASDDTIERLEQVEYKQEDFSSGLRGDGPPDDCCCCCWEEFNAERCIVRTPCKHFYHKECLKKWLKLAYTCPLCRADLEEAVRQRNAQSNHAQERSNPAQSSTGSSDEISRSEAV